MLLCAEGTEWWKKARQKQSESKQRAPLFNEFVDEEVSPIRQHVCFSQEISQHPHYLNMQPPMFTLMTARHASALL